MNARPLVAGILFAALVALPRIAVAQGGGAVEGAERNMAPVIVDGRALFHVAGLEAFPAEQRASNIADRIADAASDPQVQPQSVRTVEIEGRYVVQAGDRRIMIVTDFDGKLLGASAKTLADFNRDRIAAALVDYRREREPAVLLRAGAYSVISTLALLAILWAFHRLFLYLERRLEDVWKSKVSQTRGQAFQVVQVGRIYSLLHSGLLLLRAVLWLSAFILYLQFTMGLFPWTRSISQGIFSLLLQPLRTMGRGVLRSIPDLAFLFVLTVVIRYVLKLARAFFEGIEHGTIHLREFEPEWAQPTFRIVRVLIVAFALVVAYPYLPGSQSEAFKGVSLFLGIVFSLGSSSALSNIIAGYSLTYRRAFRIGDRIRIGEETGDVTAIRLQVTHLRSVKNEEIVIPNSSILNTTVVNYSRLAREHGLILHTKVGIGYETPWRQVHAMLLEAAARTPGLLKEPPPFVLQRELGDFAVTYELNVHCDNPQAQLQMYSDLHKNILDVFNEYGVQIMTPNYESDPAEPKLVPKSKWFDAPARPQP